MGEVCASWSGRNARKLEEMRRACKSGLGTASPVSQIRSRPSSLGTPRAAHRLSLEVAVQLLAIVVQWLELGTGSVLSTGLGRSA